MTYINNPVICLYFESIGLKFPCIASKVSRNTVQRRLRLFLQFTVIRIKRVSYGELSSPRTTKKSGNISRYFLRYIENSTLLGIISQQISFSRLDDDAESGKRLRRLLNLTWWKFEPLSHMYIHIRVCTLADVFWNTNKDSNISNKSDVVFWICNTSN